MTVWREDAALVLASQSVVRRTLLENAGIPVAAVPAAIDERALARELGATGGQAVAAVLAEAKARAVSERLPGRYVIGADQTLALGERLFNKPADRAAAAAQIEALQGHTHALYSAVSVARDGDILFSHVEAAHMTMRRLTSRDIAAYLDAAGDAVTASVGAYQLERTGVHLFERIAGDHFTILGLPLLPLLAFLRGRGLLAL